MKKIAIIGALSAVASVAMAMEGSMESTSMGNSPVKVYTNVDLNVTKLSGGDNTLDPGYSFAVGADVAYFFTNEMGASLGLDFNSLTGKKHEFKYSNTYLDIPLNFVYNWQFTPNAAALFGVGPYFGIPLAKWKAKNADDGLGGTADFDDKANTAFGINLESHVDWTLAEDFGLGAHIGFKYEFSDLDKDADATQKYWALGLGVSAKFL